MTLLPSETVIVVPTKRERPRSVPFRFFILIAPHDSSSRRTAQQIARELSVFVVIGSTTPAQTCSGHLDTRIHRVTIEFIYPPERTTTLLGSVDGLNILPSPNPLKIKKINALPFDETRKRDRFSAVVSIACSTTFYEFYIVVISNCCRNRNLENSPKPKCWLRIDLFFER